ncbi:Pentafunctional AROM protein [Ceraceosorus bombacis]|uniref:Pentafunctional AROM protein n=1 Tax=Ceraceosorus bombacis TaxID=401625 RepID=A0A0P1BI18_9BASI|nr:Pentafunctional AROM protein [Ceraceosorus bombacis]
MSVLPPSSDMSGKVRETPAGANCTGAGYVVEGNEELKYSYSFVDNVFDQKKDDLASYYHKWGRVLVLLDDNLNALYGDAIKAYFNSHKIAPTLHVFKGGELHKNMDTMLSFVDAMDKFGLIRKEPVLVVGGGLASDVAGYACASYRRSTNYIRVGTTLIALIDAAISIKVGINHGKLKNRLGAYHAPMHTFLDFDFLKTLPEGQTRNGFAEIMKISHCAEKPTWDLLVKYGPELVKTGFGRKAGSAPELKGVADEVCRRAILKMLQLESGNLHEIGLDRVIASGHGISPTLELAPFPPLRHGHAITVDMSYTIIMSHARGLLTDAERDEWFTLAQGVGLTIDHPSLDNELLHRSVEAIMKTRDGLQRFVLAGPYGNCMFANDISQQEFEKVLAAHKSYVKQRFPQYPGEGQDAYADAGDLGADPEALKAEKIRNGEHPAPSAKAATNGIHPALESSRGRPVAAA